MKQTVTIAFIILLLAGCKEKTGVKLPDFTIMLLDSTTLYNTKNIPTGKPALLIYFSPSCTHCQAETEKIINDMGRFKNVSLCYVSMEKMEDMKIFYDHYQMKRFPNIVMGKDYQYFMIGNFRPPTTPFTILYDRDKMERRAFAGEFEFSKLTKAIDSL